MVISFLSSSVPGQIIYRRKVFCVLTVWGEEPECEKNFSIMRVPP